VLRPARPAARPDDARPGAGRRLECSHLGGDRFAANALVLPHGFYYGQVPGDGAELVAAHSRNQVALPWLRGRAGVPPPAQAAQHSARQALGLLGVNDLPVVGVRQLTRPGAEIEQWVVTLGGPDGEWSPRGEPPVSVADRSPAARPSAHSRTWHVALGADRLSRRGPGGQQRDRELRRGERAVVGRQPAGTGLALGRSRPGAAGEGDDVADAGATASSTGRRRRWRRLVPARHPGAVAEHSRQRRGRRPRRRLGVHVAGAGSPASSRTPSASRAARRGRTGVVGDVEHPVVGGDQQRGVVGQAGDELLDDAVDERELGPPAGRVDAADVAGEVELGR
jgi:hypothetical protein